MDVPTSKNIWVKSKVRNFDSMLHTIQEALRSDLIEVYKMMHGFTDVPVSSFLPDYHLQKYMWPQFS